MIRDNFCVFPLPNTSNFTRHKFLDLFLYLFFKDNEINVNIPNLCPPVYKKLNIVYIPNLFSIYVT